MADAEEEITKIRHAADSLVQALAREAQRQDGWQKVLVDARLRDAAEIGKREFPQGVDDRTRDGLVNALVERLNQPIPEFNREMLIQLHGDPLSAATRDVRRNFDAVSAAILIGAAFAAGEVEVLSLKVDLSGYLAVALLLLLAYHAVSFALYRRSDEVKFQNVFLLANGYVVRLRVALNAIALNAQYLRTLDFVDVAERVDEWIKVQRAGIDGYARDGATAKRREHWEFAAPFVIGFFALLALILRVADVLPIVDLEPDCAEAREAVKDAKADQAKACGKRRDQREP